MSRILFLTPVVLMFLSCGKDKEPPAVNLGYEYFPNKVGTYITYEVDSIGYSINSDTAHYLIKEILMEEFVDDIGELAVTIERYRSDNDGASFHLTDIWTQKRTATSAQKVEEDVRYVRLVFPLEVGKTWNGNAYNTMIAWNYEYTGIDVPNSYGVLSFPECVEIEQRNNVNFVDQEIASEVYAKNVGLVYKRLTDLNFQNDMITGIDMEMVVVDYGDYVE
ncbi:MAG: hypothetical protein SH856_08775 [Flavobacteriales bacterium]|nr:hypothetical protein [Flavobacteriales bacterium]